MLPWPLDPLLLGALAGVAGTRIGWRAGNRIVLPAVETVFGAAAFAASWSASGAVSGAIAVAAWAAGSSVAAVLAFRSAPAAVEARVLFAPSYTATMRAWIERGGPIEPSTGTLLRKHLRELAVYLAAALATGNLLAIAMGAVLLNFMNAWFVELVRGARDRRAAVLLGWPCWSVVRVLAYVALGAACAQPWAVAVGRPAPMVDILRLAFVGGCGIFLDVGLKIALSPWYARRLGRTRT